MGLSVQSPSVSTPARESVLATKTLLPSQIWPLTPAQAKAAGGAPLVLPHRGPLCSSPLRGYRGDCWLFLEQVDTQPNAGQSEGGPWELGTCQLRQVRKEAAGYREDGEAREEMKPAPGRGGLRGNTASPPTHPCLRLKHAPSPRALGAALLLRSTPCRGHLHGALAAWDQEHRQHQRFYEYLRQSRQWHEDHSRSLPPAVAVTDPVTWPSASHRDPGACQGRWGAEDPRVPPASQWLQHRDRAPLPCSRAAAVRRDVLPSHLVWPPPAPAQTYPMASPRRWRSRPGPGRHRSYPGAGHRPWRARENIPCELTKEKDFIIFHIFHILL